MRYLSFWVDIELLCAVYSIIGPFYILRLLSTELKGKNKKCIDDLMYCSYYLVFRRILSLSQAFFFLTIQN